MSFVYLSMFTAIEFPATIDLFGKTFLLHPFMEGLGMFVGMRYYQFLKWNDKESLGHTHSLLILIAAALGALVGSHLVGSLERPAELLAASNIWRYIWFNNTIVGGLAGGLIAVELMKKIIGKKESTGDRMVFPLIAAIAIGRIGCFYTGVFEQTYGLPTDCPLGMYLGDDYKRHPVALYEIAFLIMLFVALQTFTRKYRYQSGVLFQLFMVSYFSFRFLLDFIKPRDVIFFHCSTIQITCLIVMIYYIYLLNTINVQKRG
ncbi:prolipoprotein diacylglyceryl transferase [Sphingobacterium thalpophilum]|uniref:Prolipoprotein diacylglyceryl transferase n=2 Tax=Sphingobacterium thalpophilum TaxID=259 RepID=A0A4U9VLM1_9SPHI|nr:prolipoprotein diacylglyceryl transferase [Sphingobacterium thalpophilum]